MTIKGAADATTAWPLFAATLLGIPGKSQPKLQSKAMGAYEGWQEFVGMTCNQGLMFGCVRLLVVHLQLYVWIQALTKQALHYFTLYIYIYLPDSQGLVLQLFSAHRICWCISFYPVVNLWEHSDGATHLTKWSKWILRDSTVRAFTTMSKSSTFAVWMLCYTGTTWHMYLFPADPPGKKPDPR